MNSRQVHIKGGGMVGLAAALSLSRLGLSITLDDIEGAPDTRVSAITPVSVKLFKALGIWETLPVSPFYQLHIFEGQETQPLIFDGRRIDTEPLGYIIENQQIINALRRDAIHRVSSGDAINGVSTPDLIIIAEGRNSPSRDAAGIECTVKDYHQQAAVSLIKTEKPHGQIARQRFLKTGPIGLLPLLDEYTCSMVWSNPLDNLQEAFGDSLGKLTEITPRQYFPLKMQHAKQYVQPKLALIGDAAHVIHPLAGFGVNMGFLDVMTLTRCIKKALLENHPIGDLKTLRPYGRARKTENALMLKVVDSFTNESLRKTGLKITQTLPFLQTFFMNWMSHHGEENLVI